MIWHPFRTRCFACLQGYCDVGVQSGARGAPTAQCKACCGALRWESWLSCVCRIHAWWSVDTAAVIIAAFLPLIAPRLHRRDPGLVLVLSTHRDIQRRRDEAAELGERRRVCEVSACVPGAVGDHRAGRRSACRVVRTRKWHAAWDGCRAVAAGQHVSCLARGNTRLSSPEHSFSFRPRHVT